MAMTTTQQFRLKLLIILGAGLIFLCMLMAHGQVINSMTLSQAVIGPDGSNYVAGATVKAWTNATPIPPVPTVKRYLTVRVTKQAAQLAKPAAVVITPPTITITATFNCTNRFYGSTSLPPVWTLIGEQYNPSFKITLPKTGSQGFIRMVTDWGDANQTFVTTNLP